MDSLQDFESPDSAPGKLRTWWHPLLVQVLAFELSDSSEVLGEVPVGKMPLRLDVFISRKKRKLPARALREMPVLAALLNQITLIQYKSPTDVLEQGDLPQFEGAAFLWFGQQTKPPSASHLTLLLIAPTMTASVRKDCERLGYTVELVQLGVHRIQGPTFSTFVLEADMLAENNPMLALFSRVILNDRRKTVTDLEASGDGMLLTFMLQQVQQFHDMGEEAMKAQFKDTDEMNLFEAEVLATIPAKKRLKGIPAEERLQGIPAEIMVEAILSGESARELSPDERALFRKLASKMDRSSGPKRRSSPRK